VALCNIHVAALMTEYLHCRGLRSEGCLAFRAISPNIVCDESNLRLDTGMLCRAHVSVLIIGLHYSIRSCRNLLTSWSDIRSGRLDKIRLGQVRLA